MMKLDQLLACPENYVLYDGDCPFCATYTRYIKFKEAIGNINLINVREHKSLANECFQQGYNLNDGMIFISQKKLYYGNEAVTTMAMLSTSSTLFNKINAFVFRKPALSKVLYPVLVTGRKLFLTLLRKKALVVNSNLTIFYHYLSKIAI